MEWKRYGKIIASVVLIFLFFHYWDLLAEGIGTIFCATVPLLLGVGFAYVLNILLNFYERYYVVICHRASIRKFRRPVCVALSFLTIFLIITVIAQMIGPALISCVSTFGQSMPQMLQEGVDWMQGHMRPCCVLLERLKLMKNGVVDWDGVGRATSTLLLGNMQTTMESAITIMTKFATVVINIVLAFVFAAYMLLRKEKLKGDLRRLLVLLLGRRRVQSLQNVYRVFNRSVHNYIVGQCTDAFFLGTLCGIGMAILGLPYPTMVGSVIGFTALVPLAGAYIGGAIGFLMVFSVSRWKAIVFLVFLLILQQIDNNLIYPKVVGSSIGLPGIWVVAAVVIGGGVAGILGMVIAVPFAAAVYQLLMGWMDSRETGSCR